MTTIAAIATAQGPGAIGIVRLSGDASLKILDEIFNSKFKDFLGFKPWVLHRGFVLAKDGSHLDDVLAVYMPKPKTYTGEDMAEIQCHGSPIVLKSILERLFELGAHPAGPGEFTKRAFLANRMDLSKAEAIAELINAVSQKGVQASLERLSGALSQILAQARQKIDRLRANLIVAVDFPDDEVEGATSPEILNALDDLEKLLTNIKTDQRRNQIIQEGARIVFLGEVNVGKSSLLNAIIGRERALVTDIAGTTRDFLEEFCHLDGYALRLIDTAGLRQTKTDDPVEALGIERSLECAQKADCLLIVLDAEKWSQEDLTQKICPKIAYREILTDFTATPKILVWNKADLKEPETFPPLWAKDLPAVTVSAKTGQGFEQLLTTISETLALSIPAAELNVSCNLRQSQALNLALEELRALRDAVLAQETYDCLAVRLDMVAANLGEITGVSTSTEVLNDIFDRFCIGK
ncbi:MAG: tRNA uridine-5-carboxymethylaminomethyl(34) synthesis GTPase MnmE [Desulfovibrionaceae bacterium]|nr:tRNA uridine-5-carboxymethylaminomethyl(34) synthesis GTPase MnmE [Desulfovibrionaceae bacterium]